MAHLSGSNQFGPERSFLCDAEMVIHRLADNGRVYVGGPSLANKMFYSAHHPFFVNQDSKKDLSTKRGARLADRFDSLHGSGQIPLRITRSSSIDSIA